MKINGNTQIGDTGINLEKCANDCLYSTQEKVIGIDYDGKPIYRKVYTSYTILTDSSVRYLIIDTDTTKIPINCYGKVKIAGSEVTFPTADAGYGMIAPIAKNGIGQLFLTITITYSMSDFRCTLEYKKTTD